MVRTTLWGGVQGRGLRERRLLCRDTITAINGTILWRPSTNATFSSPPHKTLTTQHPTHFTTIVLVATADRSQLILPGLATTAPDATAHPSEAGSLRAVPPCWVGPPTRGRGVPQSNCFRVCYHDSGRQSSLDWHTQRVFRAARQSVIIVIMRSSARYISCNLASEHDAVADESGGSAERRSVGLGC